MSAILEGKKIPYRGQTQQLFNPLGPSPQPSVDQQVVPFLGAGVSISGRNFAAEKQEQPAYPDPNKVAEIMQEMKLDGQAAVFLQVAILLACRLQVAQNRPSYRDAPDIFKKLADDLYPPSVGELSQLVSELSSYTRLSEVAEVITDVFPPGTLQATSEELIEMLKLVVSESRIANPPDALTSISSYCENTVGRGQLWDTLSFIGTKNVPSKTHRMLAAAAKHYLDQPDALDDYLIITSNYDCLMEEALDQLGLHYAVLVTRKADQKVILRFSKNMPDAERLIKKYSEKSPRDFTFSTRTRLVIIYKIHGSLSPGSKDDDGVIISDSDYVSYISQMGTNDGVIPAQVTALMANKAFLFLGYSLSDWNVRSIFETIKNKRNQSKTTPDYSVMYRVGEYEKVFFEKNDIRIIKADLNSYVDGIAEHLPDDLRELIYGKPS
ncbi:MAG TPA: SIR2 family protein [Blastocatellia bacterium]|nr:SIR2 family protein [Blastocatellia bacterium]